jgi:hypothetical protein
MELSNSMMGSATQPTRRIISGYACNSRMVMGVRVFYTSKDSFTGKDSFETEFFAPAGQDIVWKYSVTIK